MNPAPAANAIPTATSPATGSGTGCGNQYWPRPASSCTSAYTTCATPTPHGCSPAAPTSRSSRSASAMPASPPLRSTCTPCLTPMTPPSTPSPECVATRHEASRPQQDGRSSRTPDTHTARGIGQGGRSAYVGFRRSKRCAVSGEHSRMATEPTPLATEVAPAESTEDTRSPCSASCRRPPCRRARTR